MLDRDDPTSETRKLSGISLGAFETSTNVAVPVQRDVQRCRTVEGHTDVIQGYDVRYRYQGREYVTRLASPPGDRIPVEVTVAPGAPVLSGCARRPVRPAQQRSCALGV